MALKKQHHDIEAQLAQSLADLEAEIVKGTTTEITAIQARLSAQAGQMDHVRRQHNDVEQLRAESRAIAEDMAKTIDEKRVETETGITVKEVDRNEATTKRQAAQSKADDIAKAEKEATQLEIAADKKDAEKRQAVEDEKDQLLKAKESATALMVRLQQKWSQGDHTEKVLAEAVRERREVEAKTDEHRGIVQEIETGLANVKAEASKDEETTMKQISTFGKMKATTDENIEGQKENIKSKKEEKRGQVKKAIEKIRERLGEKRGTFDLFMNVLRVGSNLIEDKDSKVEAIQVNPIPTFDDEDEPIQSHEIVLSTEAVNPPSPSQQSVRRDMSGTVGGRRRRGMSGTSDGRDGTSRRRRTT